MQLPYTDLCGHAALGRESVASKPIYVEEKVLYGSLYNYNTTVYLYPPQIPPCFTHLLKNSRQTTHGIINKQQKKNSRIPRTSFGTPVNRLSITRHLLINRSTITCVHIITREFFPYHASTRSIAEIPEIAWQRNRTRLLPLIAPSANNAGFP